MDRFAGRLFHLVLILMVLSPGCDEKAPKGPHVTMKDELVPFLDSLERQYERACADVGIANWNSYSKEAHADLDGARTGLSAIVLDSVAHAIIEEWRNRSGSLADPVLARRLEMWHRCFIGGKIYGDPDVSRLENELQRKMTAFTFVHHGTPITRAQIQNGSKQARRQLDRRSLWSVPGQLSAAVARDLAELVSLRNAKARSLGFRNYYALSLSLNAIDENWLLSTLNDLEEKTREAFEEFVATTKKKLHVRTLGPWDFDYALARSALLPERYFSSDSVFQILHRFQTAIGFDVDSLPIREVVEDIPYGGLSLAITIPTDSRFLVNPTKGMGFYSTAFHEYGHSLKAVHTSVEFPILKGYEWIPGAQCSAYEEGVAGLQSEFIEDSLWLTVYTKAREKEIVRYMKNRGLPALYRLRRTLKDFFIEYEMYNNPDSNMAEIERSMFKKFLLVDLPDDEPHQYASSIWYVAYPCYYQNYIMAPMIAAQLQEALGDKFGAGKISNANVAAWMIAYLYEGGEMHEWTRRIRDATGKSLEPGAFLRKLGIEPMKLITEKEEPDSTSRKVKLP